MTDTTLASTDADQLRKTVQESCTAVERDECFEYVYGEEDQGDGTTAAQVKLRLHGWKKELGQQLDSTGLTMWRAGEDLGRYLWEKRAALFQAGQGRQHVLELGCGLGLCGLLASQLNPHGVVVLTDGDALTMEKLAQNVEDNTVANGCAVTARPLLWGEHAELLAEFPDKFDLVLAADVIYEEEAIQPLLQTVVATLREGSEAAFILSFARRNVTIDKVLAAATALGLVYEADSSFTCSAKGEHVYVMRRRPLDTRKR